MRQVISCLEQIEPILQPSPAIKTGTVPQQLRHMALAAQRRRHYMIDKREGGPGGGGGSLAMQG